MGKQTRINMLETFYRAGNYGRGPAPAANKVDVLPIVVTDKPITGPEDHREAISAARWQHFTDNTTFHGIRYIFEETPFTIRR